MDSQPKEFEGRLKAGKDWREIVAWVSDLPPMPQVASKAIVMVEDPNTTAEDLNKLLSSDQSLAARVLKISNSAMFSRQREITTLSQAIMVIGFKALKGIIVAATLRQLNKRFGNLEKMTWENSMASAMSATLICKQLGKRYVEEIFLLGLLHNLGVVVLLAQDETSKDYKQVVELCKSGEKTFTEAETEVYGFAHPLIGALVAKKWNFSAETCQVILHYSDPLEGSEPDNELLEKTYIVQLAEYIAHAAGVGSVEGYMDLSDRMKKTAKYLGFDEASLESTLEKLTEETKTRFEEEGSVYS